MAGKNPITRIIITATDQASGVFSALRDHAGKIATAIAGYFGARMFGDALGSARELEAAISRVAAASGASGGELDKLRAAAEQAGATTSFSSAEAAGALENLAKSGLNAEQAIQALPAVLNLAQAGGVELGTAAEFVTKAVSGMGLSFADAGRVADVLAMGANASNTSVEGLANALSFAAPVAQSLGLSLEQTVAIIGKFADAGIDASRAGTALNSILSQFSDPASRFRNELAAAGITTGDFDTALRQLAASGPAGERAILAVGQEAGPALRALLNQGIGALDELKAKLDESGGSAQTFAQVMSDNLDGAAKSFGSTWESVQIALAKPLLGPLKDQINAFGERLRGFVADGTITRFGEAIRDAFQSAAKWAQGFLSNVDFNKVAADMRGFADSAADAFRRFGEYATTAGGIAQTIFGVMKTGAATVAAAVLKIAEAFTGVVSNILNGVGLLNEGLSRITFGGVSERFREMATEIRTQAGAMWAVSGEFGRRASAAFDAAVDGAEAAANGWRTLTQAASESSATTTASLQTVQQQAALTAEQLDAIGESGEFVAGAVRQAGEAAVESSAKQQMAAAAAAKSVDELQQEYRRLFDAGDVAKAEAVWKQIQAAMAKTSAQAKITAADVEAAFERMGITSVAELKRAADNARRDFATIRDSGMAAPLDIQRAWQAYAEKAIAANNGVASATLQSEAAQHGLRIAVDESGRAIVQSMTEAAQATGGLGSAAEEAAAKFGLIADAADSAAAAAGAATSAAAGGGRGGGRSSSWQKMDNGQTAILDRAERLGGLQLRKQIEAEWDRWGKSRDAGVGLAGVPNAYWQMLQGTVSQLDALQMQQEQASGKFEANSPQARDTGTNVVRVEIGTGAGRTTSINTASRGDADALVDLLRRLEEDKARA